MALRRVPSPKTSVHPPTTTPYTTDVTHRWSYRDKGHLSLVPCAPLTRCVPCTSVTPVDDTTVDDTTVDDTTVDDTTDDTTVDDTTIDDTR